MRIKSTWASNSVFNIVSRKKVSAVLLCRVERTYWNRRELCTRLCCKKMLVKVIVVLLGVFKFSSS